MTIKDVDFIEGAARAMAVLESFTAGRQKLNTTQAAERAGITRAAARRHLLTLQHLGYLEGDDGQFWLAPRVLRLAGNYLSSARLPRAVQPILNRLAADTGEAFSVAVLEGAEVVIVARSGEHRTHSSVLPHGIHLGARLPVYATSTGRVLLADLERKVMLKLISAVKLAAFTQHTLSTKSAVIESVAKAKALGFFQADEEHELGVRALAVPLRSVAGNVVAALNVVSASEPLVNSRVQNKTLPTLASRYLSIMLGASAEVRTLL
jgi:IclR family transcriptional regulator, pca regulon regulatory protein